MGGGGYFRWELFSEFCFRGGGGGGGGFFPDTILNTSANK